MPDILTAADLYAQLPADRVLRYVDDSGGGLWGPTEVATLDAIMAAAEGEVYSMLLPAFGSKASIITLIANDPYLRGQLAWVALELASERKTEFTHEDGWGAHKAPYERAMAKFKSQGKGRERSQGEAQAGQNLQVGGTVQPSPPAGRANQFVFAPSKANPRGSGGF